MGRQTVALLTVELDEVWQVLRRQTRGLTDAEFFWEPGFFLKPSPECWTVHQGQVGHWFIDYATLDPDPSPFTTIAWRLVHLGACKVMYHESAFGHGALTWDELEIPRRFIPPQPLPR